MVTMVTGHISYFACIMFPYNIEVADSFVTCSVLRYVTYIHIIYKYTSVLSPVLMLEELFFKNLFMFKLKWHSIIYRIEFEYFSDNII